MSQNNDIEVNETEDVTNNITSVKDDAMWTEEHEHVLVEWADKAMCYRWLHSRSNLSYSNLNALFTIPVIIMSTLTGTANFAFQKYSPDIQAISSNIIGGINILAAILSTIAQFLKISELNEAHRVSSISWDKFYRNIKVELAKHPDERMNPTHMLKVSKEEFDRLMETSPMIKTSIILEFKNTFKFKDDPIKQEAFKQLKKPEICDELVSTEEFRHQWFKNQDRVNPNDVQNQIELLKKKRILELNEKQVINFKSNFMELHNREPLDHEIIENLKDKIEEHLLIKLIEKNKQIVIKIKN
jgi:hypothetical protein